MTDEHRDRMDQKTLAPELISLVHHVALNESGWWKKAVRRMIVAVVWRAGQPLSCREIAEQLDKEFHVQLGEAAIEAHISALRSDRELTTDSDRSKVKVAEASLRKFEQDLEASKSDGEKAREQFSILIKSFCENLDEKATWEDFNNNFLLPMIKSIGANTYRLVTGESRFENSTYLENFLRKYPETYTDCLRRVLAEFLSPRNAFTRSYILTYLNVYFLVEAAKIPGKTLEAIEKSQAKKPRFRLFLDTNVLFSILGLHDNPADSAAVTLLNLADSIKDRVELKLYVVPDTVEETRRVISAAANHLSNIGVPRNVASAASHFNLSGIVAKYFDVSKRTLDRINPQDYFAPYIENLVVILKTKGIEVYGGPIQHMHTRQDVVDDVVAQLEREQAKSDAKQKTYEALQHDVTLWHVVNDARSAALESPLDAVDWAVTLDYRFLGFDQYKQRVANRRVPVCLHPVALAQLLQFWIPMSQDVQDSILTSIQLPLIFHDFSEEDENVTLRIVQAISRFQNAEDLPEDTIRSILVDKALRARISEDVPENRQIELVRDALIEQHEMTKKKLADAEKKLEKLEETKQKGEKKIEKMSLELDEKNNKVATLTTESDSYRARLADLERVLESEKKQREADAKRLSDLENKAATTADISRFKERAIYIPLVGWVLSTVVLYLAVFRGKGMLVGQALSVWSSLFAIGWLLLAKHLGKGSKSVESWGLYKVIGRIAVGASWILGLIAASIGGKIVDTYWAEGSTWLQRALDLFRNG